MKYDEMSPEQLRSLRDDLEGRYRELCARGLDLNMARGKPSPDQLALSAPMLDLVTSDSALSAENGTDYRNYGVLEGIPEARRLMADLLRTDPGQVIVCGSSSLNIMYDVVANAMAGGVLGGEPWLLQGQRSPIKFLCPVPGYDRHFAICEHFGIEMLPVELGESGPDMDLVKRLVEEDVQVKGIWCVPMYSNPTGVTYSAETVEAFAALRPAASDFRMFWDNAYCVHHLHAEAALQDSLPDILRACARAGRPDMVYEFCSTSKITYPGAGMAAVAASPDNIASLRQWMKVQTIGPDKLNQLRHVRFLRDREGVLEHMNRHAEFLRPRFETVLRILEEDLGGSGIAEWTSPRGGYFINFSGPDGTARMVVEMAARAGVKLTAAGATFPYGKDPRDRNIRIAPSYPDVGELEQAARVFTVCVRLAALRECV